MQTTSLQFLVACSGEYMEKAGQAFTDSGKVGKQFTEDGKVGKPRSATLECLMQR